MPFDVKMPDGTIIRNVPDGTTKEQIKAKWEAANATKPQAPAYTAPNLFDEWATKATEPSPRTSVFETVNLAPAFEQGVRNVYQGLRQAGLQIGEGLGISEPGASGRFTDAVNAQRAAFKQSPQGTYTGAGAAELAGEIAPALLLRARGPMSGAAIGGGSSVLAFDPSNTPLKDRWGRAIVGAATGGLFGTLAKDRPDVRKLVDEGVYPTPGQAGPQWLKTLEDRATSIPVVGDIIRAARERGVRQLNTAAINRSLSAVGEKLPANVSGRAAVETAEDILSSKYQNLLPKLSLKPDQRFVADIHGLKAIVANATDDTGKQLDKIINNEIVSKFKSSNGTISGEVFKGIEENLGKISRGIHGNPGSNWDQRVLAEAVDEAKTAIRNLLSRSNPEYASQLKDINRGWAVFNRIRRAASVDKTGEMFTPSQLQAAVKAADKGGKAFAKGEALLQDLSEPAYRVMGRGYPDSGTAGRLMQGYTIVNPPSLGLPHVIAGAGMLPYVPGFQQGFTRLMLSPGLRGVPYMAGPVTEELIK